MEPVRMELLRKCEIEDAYRHLARHSDPGKGLTINQFLFEMQSQPYKVGINWREGVLFFC